MTASELYRRLTFPTRFRVLGYRLVAFEVGHARIIDRLEIREVGNVFDALLVAKICSMPSAKAERWLNSRTLQVRMWWMTQTRRRLLRSKVEADKAIAVVSEYLNESTRGPRYTSTRDSDGEDSGLGAPYSQHLRATLLSRLNYAPDKIDSTPFLVAVWDYLTFLELDGHIRIIEGETEEEEAALIREADELLRKVQSGEVKVGS